MEKQIKTLLNKSLSNDEIMNIIDGKANLIPYSKVHKYKTLDQLLGKYKACIILYETKQNYGHWCCIFMNTPKLCEFFDPYGLFPDVELKFINNNYAKMSYQDKKYLTQLMIDSPYLLSYNHFPFQQLKEGVNTCGRWVALRLLFRHLLLDDFIKIFGKKRGFSKDVGAALITINA